MAAGDVRAGGAYVEIGARTRALEQGLMRASAKVNAFAGRIRGIGMGLTMVGAAITAPLTLSVKMFANYGDQVAKMSRRTGVGVEALGRLGHAADLTGANMETLEKGLRTMQRATLDAKLGLSTSLDALEELGLEYKDIANLAPEEQFALMADRMNQLEDPTIKAGVAMKFFGRAGTALIPMFDLGSEGIKQIGKDTEYLGLVFDKKAAKAAEDLTDEFDRAKKSMRGISIAIGASLAPMLIQLSRTIVAGFVATREFISENREMIMTITKVGAGILAAGIFFTGAAAALSLFAGLMSGLASVMGIVIAIFSPLGIAILAGVTAFVLLGDTILSIVGISETGMSDIVAAIRIGSHSIGTWFEIAGLKIRKVWEQIKDMVMASNDSIKLSAKATGQYLTEIWAAASGAVANAFWDSIQWIVEKFAWLNRKISILLHKLGVVTDEQLGRALANTARAIENTAKFTGKQKEKAELFYGETIGDAEKRRLDAWNKYQEDKLKSAEDTAKKIELLEKSITEVAAEDLGKTGPIAAGMAKIKELSDGIKSSLGEATDAFGRITKGQAGRIGEAAITPKTQVFGGFSAAGIMGATFSRPVVSELKTIKENTMQIARNTEEMGGLL